MGGLSGIYGNDNKAFEALQSALNRATAADDSKTIDAFFTLEDKNNPLGVRDEVGNKKLADRKIKNLTKGSSSACTPVGTFKYNLSVILNTTLSPKIHSDPAMLKYLDEIKTKLLGHDATDTTIMNQTMDVRTLKQMIAGVWKKADDVMLQQYRNAHADAFREYDAALADLAVLAEQATDETDREKVGRMANEFKNTIQMMKESSLHDTKKFTESMDAVISLQTKYAVELRAELLGKVFAHQVQEKCDAFKAKAADVEKKFGQDWDGLGEDALKDLSESEKSAALKRLKEKSAALLEEAGKLKPGASVNEMKATLANLEKTCAQAGKELDDLATDLLDKAEDEAGARTETRRAYAADCEKLAGKMAAFVEESVRELTTQWQEKYGADGADDLAEACKTLRDAVRDADGWRKDASDAGDLRQGESTEDLKQRLDSAKAAFAEKLKGLGESMKAKIGALVEAEGPKYAALIAGRQKESLCNLAKAALNAFQTTIAEMIDAKKNEVEKAKLKAILGEAEAFAQPQETEGVDAVKARYLAFVGALNKLYVKAAVDPTKALKDAFDRDLKAATDTFKSEAEAEVAKFRASWDAKFKDNPAYGTTLSKSLVDGNRQAIEKMLAEQIGRLADDVAFEVRNESGQGMVLTEALKGRFSAALESLKRQAENLLADVAGEVEKHAAAQKKFDAALGALGKAIADVDDAVNGWSATGGKMVRNAKGRLLPETKLYLSNRLATFQDLLVGMMKSVGGAGMLSSQSLEEAADALSKFGNDVHDAFRAANGKPEKLAQLLRALPTPTLVVKTVARDVSDKAFIADEGALPKIDEKAPQTAKGDLQALLGLLKETHASLAGRGIADESSRNAFLALAREVYEDVVGAVNDGVAAGKADDFKSGIGKLVREAWGKVSAYVDVLENDARQKTLATKAQAVLEALKTAKDEVPEKLNRKKYLAVRQGVLSHAQRTVEAYAKLVAVRLDEIRKAGGVPDKAQLDAALAKLDDVTTWLNGFKANVKPQAGNLPPLARNVVEAVVDTGADVDFVDVSVRYELADVPLNAAVRPDAFNGTNNAGPETVAALREQVAAAQAQARQDALSAILNTFDADLKEERNEAESEGATRLTAAQSDADAKIAEAGAKRRVEAQNAPQERAVAEKGGVQAEDRPVVAPKKLSRREMKLEAERREKARAEAHEKFDAANRETYAAYAKDVRARGAELFLNVKGMESYLVRDEDGNARGWTQDGEQILEAVVREQVEIRRNDAFNGYYGDGTQLDGKEMKAELKELSDVQLTDAIEKACRAFEARYSVSENLRPKAAAQGVPKGSGVFGLDVDRLSKEQRRGLTLLLRQFTKYAETADDDETLRQRHLKLDHSFQTNMATALEKAIHSGALRLENVTKGLAILLMDNLTSYEWSVSEGTNRTGAGMGFGTNDVGTMLRIIGDAGIDPQLFADMSEDDVNRFGKLINVLLVMNGNEPTGLDALCRRVFGDGVWATMTKIVGNGGKGDPMALLDKMAKDCNNADREDDIWRAKYDPYARAKPEEQRVVAMLRMEYAYATGKRGQDDLANVPKEVGASLANDKADLLAFRQMLADLSGGQAPKTLSRKIGGVEVTLVRDEAGALKGSVKIVQSTLKYDKDKNVVGVNHLGGTVAIPVDVPLKLDAMREMLDETILANVPLFKREAVAPIFAAAKGKPGFETSSQMRQTCVTFFKSFANVDAAKLCFLSTADLVKLVDRLLGPEGDRYEGLVSLEARRQAVEHDMLSSAAFDETLNSRATLEVYRKYAEACKANPEDVNSKVSVPEPERVRKDETLTQSRVRRLHEFAAELIQPNDTTKFDLDRQADVPRQTIMRRTILAHADEVRELLAMDDEEILRFFSLKGGKGASLNAFAVAVLDLAKGLRAIRDANGIDALFSMLRSESDPTTEKLLLEASEALADSSKSVLENLQLAFQDLFVEAFGKKGEIQETEIWKKTLDELANTVTIDPNKGYGGFLKEVLGTYFGRMTPTDCQRMAALTMRYAHADASLGQVLGGLLKGAGPILQKLMQGLPQSALPPELQVAVEDVKSNLAPIATEAVRAHLYDVVQESNGRITNVTVLKSLGAASVGQAFLCLVKTVDHPEGEECVIKLLRPDVQNRARREDQFFQRILNEKPEYGIMLNERFARIFDELDLTIEGTNVAQGVRYDPNGDWYAPLRVRSMKMHPASRSTTNVLFLRRAPGTTFDRYVAHLRAERKRLQASVETHVNRNGAVTYRSSDPYAQNNASAEAFRLYVDALQRQKDMADFITRWTEEVAFGNGFFHGDVHAGNIMTDERGLTVIDYGNASQFTHVQQQKVTNLLVSAVRNKPGDFFDTFVSFLSAAGKKDAEGKAARIKKDLSEIFAKGGTADVGKRFVAALQYLQNADVELPGELFNLIECMRRLDESLVSMQKELDELRRLNVRVDKDVTSEVEAKYWFDQPLVDALNALHAGNDAPFDEAAAKNSVSDAIFEACKRDRRHFEETMADVRKLVRNADVSRKLDCRAQLETLLAVMEDPAAFLDPNRENAEKAWRDFADAVAGCIVQIQKSVIAGFKAEMDVSTTFIHNLPRGLSFTDAIEAACMRHVHEILDAMDTSKKVKEGLNFIGKKIAEKFGGNTKTPEEKYKDRLDAMATKVDHTRNAQIRQLTPEEIELTRSLGRYFALPSDFENTVTTPKWAQGAANRDKVLRALKVTIDKLENALAERRKAGDPVPTKGRPEDSIMTCLPLLAAYYGARFEKSGFEALTDGEISSLQKDAFEIDKTGKLMTFVVQVREYALGTLL